MIAEERETTCTVTDADDVVQIWTNRRADITRLRGNDRVTEVASGHFDRTEWAEFTVERSAWNPVSGVKRRAAPMSEERRAALATQLAKARETTA